MATKPTDFFTWATDTNYTNGDAAGNPTKLNPPGFPNVVEGLLAGDPAVIEYLNKAFNITGQWITGWALLGSSAGAANAHIVETDASGNTNVQALRCLHGTTGLVVDNRASIGGKLVLLGAAAGIQFRTGTIGDADQDITVASDTWYLTAQLSATRTYTLRHTGTVPVDGQRIRVTLTLGSSLGTPIAIFQREDTTEIARITGPDNDGWVEFSYLASKGWFVIGLGGKDAVMTTPH